MQYSFNKFTSTGFPLRAYYGRCSLSQLYLRFRGRFPFNNEVRNNTRAGICNNIYCTSMRLASERTCWFEIHLFGSWLWIIPRWQRYFLYFKFSYWRFSDGESIRHLSRWWMYRALVVVRYLMMDTVTDILYDCHSWMVVALFGSGFKKATLMRSISVPGLICCLVLWPSGVAEGRSGIPLRFRPILILVLPLTPLLLVVSNITLATALLRPQKFV